MSGSSPETVKGILDAFRDEGVSFLTPYAPRPLSPDTMIDISHEALIRRWNRIADPRDGWLAREFNDGLVWRSLLVQTASFEKDPRNILSPATTADRVRWIADRNAVWSERYGGRWDAVQRLLQASDAEARARERQTVDNANRQIAQARRETRNARLITALALVATLVVVASVYLIYRERLRAAELTRATRSAALTAFSEQSRQQNPARAARLALAALAMTREGDDPLVRDRAVGALRSSLNASSLNLLGRHDDYVRSVAVLADGRVVSGSDDHRVLIWSLDRPEDPVELGSHKGWVFAILQLTDGRVVSADDGGTIRVWDPKVPGRLVASADDEDSASVNCLANGPNGRFVSGDSNGRIVVRDPDHLDHPVLVREGPVGIVALAFLADGRLVSGDSEGTIRLWDTGLQESAVVGTHESLGALAVRGSEIVSGGQGGIRIWDAEKPGGLKSQIDTGGDVLALAVAADGSIVLGDWDKRVRMVPTGSDQVIDLGRHDDWVRAVAMLPDGRVVSGSDDGRVLVWAVGAGAEGNAIGRDEGVTFVDVLPDGQVVSGDAPILDPSIEGRILLWDPQRPGTPATLGTVAHLSALAVTRDGKVVSGDAEGVIQLWNPASPGQPVVLGSGQTSAAAVAVMPDGTIASLHDTRLLFWDVAHPGTPAYDVSFGSPLQGFAFLGDGRAVVASEGFVGVADVLSRKTPADVKWLGRSDRGREDESDILSITVMADGRIASGDEEGRVRLWDARTPDKSAMEIGRHQDWVRAVAFLPDGSIVSGGDDGAIWRWDPLRPGNGVQIGRHEDWVRAIAVANADEIVSVADDAAVRSWRVSVLPDELIAFAKSRLLISSLTPEDRRLFSLP